MRDSWSCWRNHHHPNRTRVYALHSNNLTFVDCESLFMTCRLNDLLFHCSSVKYINIHVISDRDIWSIWHRWTCQNGCGLSVFRLKYTRGLQILKDFKTRSIDDFVYAYRGKTLLHTLILLLDVIIVQWWEIRVCAHHTLCNFQSAPTWTNLLTSSDLRKLVLTLPECNFNIFQNIIYSCDSKTKLAGITPVFSVTSL